MQANCIKCQQRVQHLDGGDEIARGEWLFQELGCHGCHLTEGYEELSKDHGVSSVGRASAASAPRSSRAGSSAG